MISLGRTSLSYFIIFPSSVVAKRQIVCSIVVYDRPHSLNVDSYSPTAPPPKQQVTGKNSHGLHLLSIMAFIYFSLLFSTTAQSSFPSASINDTWLFTAAVVCFSYFRQRPHHERSVHISVSSNSKHLLPKMLKQILPIMFAIVDSEFRKHPRNLKIQIYTLHRLSQTTTAPDYIDFALTSQTLSINTPGI